MASYVFLLGVLFAVAGCGYPNDDRYPLNALRWKGTHNSYHVAREGSPSIWAYTHPPLDQQLERHAVRQFELDLYAHGDDFDVQHIPVVDNVSTCATLSACLDALKKWHDSRPNHAPIVVMLELKEIGQDTDQEPYFQRLHQLLTTHVGSKLLITPASVTKGTATIRDALATRGWPTLRDTRGKFLFFLLTDAAFEQGYAARMNERLAFVASAPGLPYSAVRNVDVPTDTAAIDEALAAHMLVRTRADDPEVDQDKGARAAAALQSGAHFIATDYEAARDGYELAWPPHTIVACHPTLAVSGCKASDLERD